MHGKCMIFLKVCGIPNCESGPVLLSRDKNMIQFVEISPNCQEITILFSDKQLYKRLSSQIRMSVFQSFQMMTNCQCCVNII